MSINLYNTILFTFCIWLIYMSIKFYSNILRPYLVKKSMKEIEKNPYWLISALRTQYYGLDDVDVILVENKYGVIPQFRAKVIDIDKKNKTKEIRLELLLPSSITTKEIDDIAKIALLGKICIKVTPSVGILYASKPTYWLSILNYMLDGGNINQSAVSWEEKDKKHIDF